MEVLLHYFLCFYKYRISHPEVSWGKDVLKICNKFAGEHHCRSVISIKLGNNFIEITLWNECSPVNLLHIFRTPVTKNTSEQLLLQMVDCIFKNGSWDSRSLIIFIKYIMQSLDKVKFKTQIGRKHRKMKN